MHFGLAGAQVANGNFDLHTHVVLPATYAAADAVTLSDLRAATNQ